MNANTHKKNMARLLRAVRKASGYRNLHKWEAGTDYGKDNPNHPFKPAHVQGEPWSSDQDHRADHWDGGMTDWEDVLSSARVGHSIDFYVYNREELETNVHVLIKSETEAVWADCGSAPRTITLLGGVR